MTGRERWVLTLRPYVEAGYTRGHVEDGRLTLVQDITGHEISLPMPSSDVRRWYAGGDLVEADNEESATDITTEVLMSGRPTS